ncbi:MAG: MauE/DoxX family redox-associated membrane protein [Bacteroidota bacterium]
MRLLEKHNFYFMHQVLAYLFAGLLIVSAIAHIVNPAFYKRLIPDFINPRFAHILSFITELGAGILLILPQYRPWGGLAFMILMIAFMPIHIWDWTKERPMVGSKNAAIIRIIVQVVLIYAGWWIYSSPNAL